MKCTKKRDARAELLFCLFNQLLLNPEYSSRIRNRTRSHLESRIQVPLTKTGIRSPRRGIQNPGLSWIPLHGAINLIKRKDGPLPLRNIRLESQTRRAIHVSVTELNAMAKRRRQWESVYSHVLIKLYFLHTRNYPLIAADYFPVSCGN